MSKRAAAVLCLLGAALGAAAMLMFLPVRHDYGMKLALQAAETELPILHPGDPPPRPSEVELERARLACERLSRASGMSLSELGHARRFIRTRPARHVDHDALEASFGGFDRLRMTLFGLSQRDQERASNSVRHEPRAEWWQRRLAEGLREALRACGHLSGDPLAIH